MTRQEFFDTFTFDENDIVLRGPHSPEVVGLRAAFAWLWLQPKVVYSRLEGDHVILLVVVSEVDGVREWPELCCATEVEFWFKNGVLCVAREAEEV